MKKKLFLTAASAILTLGVLAACGDEGEDPTLNGGTDTEMEMDTGEMDSEDNSVELELDSDVSAEGGL
ncbi:hypothetical protein ACFFHM_00480 [Halalkalibacter kiskunsagensis]|uniref:Uncharacterized protein n=1 Tax=Halalkalibacter kiskunsagensis TaxID=1548599 RepID=A0ABV6K772_9BACI